MYVEIAAPPGSVLPVHETVTLRFETAAVGVFPVGIETAFADWDPEPPPGHEALAPAAGAAKAIASARTIVRWRPRMASARVDQLVPVSVTGIVNVAPWHAFSEAFDMLAAPVSVVWSTPSTPPLFAGTLSERLLWFVNVTPVVVHPEWPASAVIVPLPVTAVTVTAYGFGLSILTRTSPETPG